MLSLRLSSFRRRRPLAMSMVKSSWFMVVWKVRKSGRSITRTIVNYGHKVDSSTFPKIYDHGKMIVSIGFELEDDSTVSPLQCIRLLSFLHSCSHIQPISFFAFWVLSPGGYDMISDYTGPGQWTQNLPNSHLFFDSPRSGSRDRIGCRLLPCGSIATWSLNKFRAAWHCNVPVRRCKGSVLSTQEPLVGMNRRGFRPISREPPCGSRWERTIAGARGERVARALARHMR